MVIRDSYIKYSINKEKRTVVCYFDTLGSTMNFCMDYVSSHFNRDLCSPMFSELSNMNKNQTIGVAKCDGSDVFDEFIGKKIAKQKLEFKIGKAIEMALYRIAIKACKQLHKFIEDNHDDRFVRIISMNSAVVGVANAISYGDGKYHVDEDDCDDYGEGYDDDDYVDDDWADDDDILDSDEE